jgi:mono/diheme cytochrome c family protein
MTRGRWVGLAVALLLVGTRSLAAQATDTAAAARVARGKAIFEGKGLCFSCHGKAGDGVLGPTTKLVGRALAHVKPVASAIAALIRTGVDSATSTSGQLMPPRGGSRISDAEIDAVAEYVVELRRKAPS